MSDILNFINKHGRTNINDLDEETIEIFHRRFWCNPMHYFKRKCSIQFPFNSGFDIISEIYKLVYEVETTKKISRDKFHDIYRLFLTFFGSLKIENIDERQILNILHSIRLLEKFMEYAPIAIPIEENWKRLYRYPHYCMIFTEDYSGFVKEKHKEWKEKIISEAHVKRQNPKKFGITDDYIRKIYINPAMRLAETGSYRESLETLQLEKENDRSVAHYKSILKYRLGIKDYTNEIEMLKSCEKDYESGIDYSNGRDLRYRNGYFSISYLCVYIFDGMRNKTLVEKSQEYINKQFNHLKYFDFMKEQDFEIHLPEPLYYTYIYLWPYYKYVIKNGTYL